MKSGFKTIVMMLRERMSVRRIARELSTPVDRVHENCGCLNGRNCTGPGCRIR